MANPQHFPVNEAGAANSKKIPNFSSARGPRPIRDPRCFPPGGWEARGSSLPPASWPQVAAPPLSTEAVMMPATPTPQILVVLGLMSTTRLFKSRLASACRNSNLFVKNSSRHTVEGPILPQEGIKRPQPQDFLPGPGVLSSALQGDDQKEDQTETILPG